MTHPHPRALEAAARAVCEIDCDDPWDEAIDSERAHLRWIARAAVTAYLAEAGDGRLAELERENARMREALFETHLDLVVYTDIEVARKRLVKRRAALAGSEKP